MAERYYVYRHDGEVTRIAKIEGGNAWGYALGEWVMMPQLLAIEHDVGEDAVEVDEREAMRLIEAYEPSEWDKAHYA